MGVAAIACTVILSENKGINLSAWNRLSKYFSYALLCIHIIIRGHKYTHRNWGSVIHLSHKYLCRFAQIKALHSFGLTLLHVAVDGVGSRMRKISFIPPKNWMLSGIDNIEWVNEREVKRNFLYFPFVYFSWYPSWRALVKSSSIGHSRSLPLVSTRATFLGYYCTSNNVASAQRKERHFPSVLTS